MEREESGQTCEMCGDPLDEDAGPCFAFGEDGVLCWGCALARGGSYSADEDRWTRDPRVDDLLHAPP